MIKKNVQHNSIMKVRRFKTNQRNTPGHSSLVTRPISAVTSIGSYESEIVEDIKEANINNSDSITPETNSTLLSSKVSGPSTTTPVVQIASSTNKSNDAPPVLHYTVQKPCCPKIITEQVM